MNIKRIRVLKNILIGGGLTVALLFWLSLKTTAEIYYENGQYNLKTETAFVLFPEQKETTGTNFGSYYCNLNGDSFNEKIYFKDKSAEIFLKAKSVFKTDPEWAVEEVLCGDFNNDGKNEVGFYLWKKGSYGTSKPFWVKENDESYKQHLFLYDWDDRQQKIAPLWHSSNLPYINIETFLKDMDKDGKNELIVLEKPYDYLPGQYARNIAVWRWDEWGFKNIWRSADGKFDDLEVSK